MVESEKKQKCWILTRSNEWLETDISRIDLVYKKNGEGVDTMIVIVS